MKKGSHKYQITINTPSDTADIYTYDYAATRGRNIMISVSSKGIRISAELSTLYETAQIVTATNYIFADAIKKSLLLYIIRYSENINIKRLCVSIDDESEEVLIQTKPYYPPVFSLVDRKLYTPIPREWDNKAFINKILSKTPSKYAEDPRFAALFATVCAKSKIYEAERFMYFWMAFNGIYSYFSKRIDYTKGKTFSRESQQITNLLKLFDYGQSHIKEKDSVAIAREVMSVVTKNDLAKVRGISDISEEVLQEIKEKLVQSNGTPYNIKPEGYLLACFAYYFRCNYFHAGRILPLFCYKDERELKCLHLINTLLEEFIDNNLYLLFDRAYVDKTYGEKIVDIAKGK